MPKRLQKELSADIHLLGDLLGKVIRRQAGVETFDLEERFRALSKVRRQDRDAALEVAAKIAQLVESLDLKQIREVARAFTLYFQLINVAEDHHRARVLRARMRGASKSGCANSTNRICCLSIKRGQNRKCSRKSFTDAAARSPAAGLKNTG